MKSIPAMERARRGTNPKPATPKQLRYLRVLARKAGVEMPRVAWAREADEAIKQLEKYLRQPQLEGLWS